MFIAHLPAGYLLTTFLQRKLQTTAYLWIGLVASVIPDLDMLYFYLIDDRQTLHHHYWTHLPLFWTALWIITIFIGHAFKRRNIFVITTIIYCNLILHFVLDSFVGGINWLYPFIDHDLFLITVPATREFWVWSFMFHWSFLVEITILLLAILLFFNNRKLHHAKA